LRFAAAPAIAGDGDARELDADGGRRGVIGALIAAVREADDSAGLVAVLPVAGHTLVERQIRLAVAAGAGHIVVLVERIPAGLTQAIDRLRRDGIAVDVARSAADGADRFHPDEAVLVFADGALAGPHAIARLAATSAPAILTLGEGGPAGPFERIDAGARWSGVALVSGDLLRRTVAQLGDWDLHSTLLRRAVGASARRIDIADGAGLSEAEPVMLVRSIAGARAATHASLTRDDEGEGWPTRLLYGPFARAAIGAVLDRPVEAAWLRYAGLAAAVTALPCAWLGWLLAAILLLVGGAALAALGRLLGRVRLHRGGPGDLIALGRNGAAGVALALFAAHRLDAGWTAPLLAAITIGAMAALARERRILVTATEAVPPAWIADADALVLLFALFAAGGVALPGLLGLALYASVSFAAVQHRLLRLIGKSV
jgi:hypothetical protein